MHYSPLQLLVEHTFYGIADFLFFALTVYAACIVNRGKWRLHLGWLIPFVIQTALTLIYRGIMNVHYFLGVHLPQGAYVFGLDCLYASDGIGIYGTIILCQTFKRLVKNSDIEIRYDQPSLQTGESIWPPPPAQGGF